ncbi:type I polyketide synthase [Labedaea rhizosphaerae]|uniref:6-deoxyerythronolide-B synthase n=1 Tax=Labedaea rhizosphaerae TaxID=598644 RepID=A0A4R6S072_LABRH|nr:type I polyketide synthase [Labedaea rhizosphaerae]TDP92882.1 acyl transferase domain-containing protein [Labedaea rhizosphaerae]
MADEAQLREYLKRATADLSQVRARLRAVEAADREPIAIIGMSCRYPGGVDSPEALWRLVSDGTDAISPFPTDRGWDLGFFDGAGANFSREGGFLDDLAGFDPAPFGISPREAQAMDPQQRLVLEASWEALERAGLDPLSLRGSRTGVFAGAMYSEYIGRALAIPEGVGPYVGTGSAGSVISGRVSYTLGLEGPALTVDTACSSSLVALHLAGQALRAGECTLALAGGVSALVTPNTFVDFAVSGGLAEDGRCKSFAASADGASWAEGVGMLVLERLGDARRNGHRVLAVVRGSAVNQDGASSGLTVPNGPSQQRVIRAALRAARLAPSDVDAVEAHGTGTTLGDPIEAQALLATYGQDRDRPLWLGSVKSNLGHAQAAAGVGGVIKMVMALRNEALPKTLHVDEPTPHVDWTAGAVELLTEHQSWPRTAEPRRAGVSSFGVSGTNAHAIIEEAPPAQDTEPVGTRPAVVPWVISGKTAEALTAQAARLLDDLTPDADPVDVGHALVATRATLDHRAVVLGDGTEALRAGLATLADDGGSTGVVRRTGDLGHGGVVFVFPGQGAQWAGMAAELLDTAPAFRARIEQCAAALAPHWDHSLLDVLREDPLDRVDVVQPASWAVMVSLAALWQTAGVTPEAVVGHSQGEIAAAVVAGALSLEDGARVVALRSKVIGEELSGHGGMVSVAASATKVADLLTDGISIAAENGPLSTVVSGDPVALTALLSTCADRAIRARRIPVDYASHSAQVERLRERLQADLATITPRPADVPFHSTVTEAPATLDADYWFTNLRQTVHFDRTIRALVTAGRTIFLEVSPHPVLTGAITETVDACGARAAVLASLRRDEGGLRRWLTALAEAHVHGVAVDWTAVVPEGRPVDLPTYAFQHKRYWLETAEWTPPPSAAGPARFWDAVDRVDLDTLTGLLDVTGDTPLRTLLPTLAAWHRQDREQSLVDSWRYRVAWRPVATRAARLDGTWLLPFAEGMADNDLVRACWSALESSGATVVPFELTETDRASLAGRLDGIAVTGVLSLLALNEDPRPAHPSLPAGLADTLTLLHGLKDAGITAPIWCVTRNAVCTGPSDRLDHPDQALLWGFGRVVAHEYPTWGGLIDLDGTPDARLAAVLTGDEPQVALRANGVLAARLARASTQDVEPVRTWRPNGTVLVTGGTGGIGTHVARWLARAGAEHLLLVSRRGPAAPGARELAAELTELGTRVTIAAADPADKDVLAGLLAEIPAEHPLTAVFHAAGVVDSGIVDSLTVERMDHALRAKRQVALNLHELTRELDLSAFVLFSSLAGVFGAAGEGNYGPGNAFLDAFAQHRRDLGLPATSIAWGAWAGAGMAEGALGDAMGRHGIPRMDPALGIAGLQQVLDHDDTSVAVADLNWDTFAYFFTATHHTHLLDELAPKPAAEQTAQVADTDQTPLAASLVRASAADRNRALLDLVREQVQQVLGYESVAEVEPGRAFSDLGLSSAGSVELRNRLTLLTGLRIPATVVFDHPTSTALARFLATELTGDVEETPVVPAAAVTDEPIAIVGMSCRFPGGVSSPDDLWRLVSEGTDALTPFPADRGWDLDALYHPDPDHPGTSYAREGGFVAEATAFDPGLFGISPREALAMDPQQRMLLEASWEAFERAGIDPLSLRGSRTGVYAGTSGQDYPTLLAASPEGAEGYLATGGSLSVVSGRIAYTFGLEGPAVTVDTACSSSLVALHLAAQALRQGDCDLALAGGVTVLAGPGIFVEFSRQRGMSADGRCKSFAAAADGAGWGEGVGVLVVERLADARRHGHDVLAVVRGSSINSDGASNGLTAPSGTAQQRVIRHALANAGLQASEVDAVEAHGTGTRLGDPIEATALLATYGKDRERPLLLGSVKSNIGHTQAASGVAGVIKSVLALRHGTLPKTLHVDAPSPHVDWAAGSVELLTEARPFPATGRPNRVGVSSFGVSGTNAHVILEQVPETATDDPEPVARPVPWVLSGASEAALRSQAARLRSCVDERPLDLAYSLATTRSSLPHRAVVVGTDRDDLLAGLDAVLAGRPHPAVATGVAGDADSVTLVFPGHGSQWVGMARDLLAESPVFAARMRACADALAPFVDWSLLDVLDDAEALDRIDVVQPALWAVMVSLARTWQSLGVPVGAVLGHSQGEIAAAVVAGALSLDDGARVVALRAKALVALAGRGGMVSVPLPVDQVRERVAGSGLSIAVLNGPSSVVVSGDLAAVDELLATCAADGIRARRVAANYAPHSAQVEDLRAHLLDVLAPITPRDTEIPLYSSVTGEVIDGTRLDAEHWYRGLRETAEFERATRAVLAAGTTVLVECSPHPVLTVGLQETIEDAGAAAVAVGSLRRDEGDLATLLGALARVHVAGVRPDWTAVFAGTGARRVALPTYAFQHERFWPSAPKPVAAGSGDETGFWSVVEAGELDTLAAELAVDPAAPLTDVLPALAAWRRRRHEESTVDSWRYRAVWRPADGAEPTSDWVVVAPAGHAWATAACSALAARYVEFDGSGAELAGVTSGSVLGFLDPDGTVALLQTLNPDVRLWCATSGAVSTGRSDPLRAPEQAALWGLGRVAALEHPQRWGGLVDLPETPDERAAARLAQALGGSETELAVRASGVFTRRLVRAAASATVTTELTGTALITGGTGALGAQVARLLADRGADRVVLLSRRGPDAPGAAELVAELPCAEAVACDVTDRDALAAVIAGIPDLTVVVHTASVLDDGVLDAMTPERMTTVWRVKAESARTLHELTADRDLTAFVLFSSAAATFGNAGQANYAAANAYLDALAEHRAGQGLPATSIAWGAWADAGLAADSDRVAGGGITPMRPALALTALDTALTGAEPVLTIADIDWARFHPGFTAARPTALFDELDEVAQLPAPARDATTMRDRFAGLTAAERDRALLDLVRDGAAAVLRHASTDAIEPGKPFQDLGFDSLTAIEFRNLVAAATGLALPSTLVFDYPNPLALAEHLAVELGGEAAAVPTGTPAMAAEDDDPVVVVGMGCRFPGGVHSPEDLWELLLAGQDAISPMPTDRGWNVEAGYDPDPDKEGAFYVRESGFVHDAAEFDPAFFGISPREALAMDPQQRLLLETTWEALERAGIDPLSLRGSATGVFAGINYQDYGSLSGKPDGLEGHLMTGNAGCVLSGRIAYTLGLEGPAVTIDTACSASLVALHLAAQSLRQGESTLAIAGGATIMCTPGMLINFSRQRGLALDSRCKAFDVSADGTGWSEGAGIVVLERLSDARRHGHPVLAVLRGSAVNSDGASNGLTAPSGPAQQRVVRAALAAAGLAPSEVDAVEAHGTGTALGDPIEAQALLATYGQDRAEPLRLGSLKSNIGHTQAAAGVASVIKTVLALQHGVLPKTLHVAEPTPHVDWSAGSVRLLTETEPWPATTHPRRVGVSAFGISGTNAHAIFEQAPDLAVEPVEAGTARDTVTWPLAGDTEAALRDQATRLAAHLDAHPELSPLDVGYALATTRSALRCRSVAVGGDADELRRGLAAIADGTAPTGFARQDGELAVLFTGQGDQHIGMGRELYDTYPVFADAFDAVCARVDPELTVPLRDVVFGAQDTVSLQDMTYAQPALLAIEVALYRLVESLGVRPDVLIGHSVGELTAAHIAGVLSLDDACTLVAARGRLMAGLPAGGEMIAVEASEEEVEAFDGVSAAAINGPSSVVMSGRSDAVAVAAESLALRGRRVKRLPISHASHSAAVDPMLPEFQAVADRLSYAPPKIPILSTVTGERLTGEQACDPAYWVMNVRKPVRFHAAVTTVRATRFLELGPDGALTAVAQRSVPDNDELVFVAAQRRDKPQDASLLSALGVLHAHGVGVDWAALFAGTGARTVPLPTYAFQRSRYWLGGSSAPARPVSADPVSQAFERQDIEALAGLLDVDRTHLDAVVPALSAWQSRQSAESLVDGWRYRVRWQAGEVPAGLLRGTWLAVTTGDAWSAAAVDGLAADGATFVPFPLTVHEDRASLATRLRALPQRFDGVVSLVALDESPHPAAPAVPVGVAATLALAQALGDAAVDAPLWSITRCGTAMGATVRPNQAQVWGLGRVVGLEAPHRWGGQLDLPEDLDTPTLARARAILAGGAAVDEAFAVRPAGVFVRRIVPAPSVSAARWEPRGTVLITGGTGALGAHVARYAAGAGAQRLVLTSRRGPDAPGAAALAEELTALGAAVTITACDGTDRDGLAAVLDAIAADGPPLTAVCHTAGVGQLSSLDAVDLAGFAAVVDAKVTGARLLDELLGDTPLDAFVLFSSVSGVWGSPGQPAYAAANAWLDALAENRAARGLVATSVAWGGWQGDGMAADADEALRRQGLRPMPADRAVTALTRAIARRDAAVVVSDMDWPVFVPAYSAARHRPLFDELPDITPEEPAVAADAGLRARVAAAAPGEVPAIVLEAIRAMAAAVLGHPDQSAVEADRAFRDLGFDSLTAVEMRNRCQKLTGVRLAATVVFDHPTPASLAAELVRLLSDNDTGTDPGTDRGSGTDSEDTVFAELDRLESLIGTADVPGDRDRIARRLRSLLAKVGHQAAATDLIGRTLGDVTDTELFDLVDRDLGVV